MADFRVLIVGAGQMGRGWGETLRDCPDTTIVAWVDVLPGAAARAAAELGLADVLTDTDLDRAITAARPDFVVDVSPPETLALPGDPSAQAPAIARRMSRPRWRGPLRESRCG